MPRTIAQPASAELTIKKSRFLACVQPAADKAQAHALVAAQRLAHPGANHVCWALLATRDSAANDDGEPGGTAGLPMLAVLRKQDLTDVLTTVVRYFGGIKLGAGGLVRAYTGAVALALQQADLVPVRVWADAVCVFPYALEGSVRRALDTAGAHAVHAAHGARVELRFNVPADALPALQQHLRDLSAGQLTWLAPAAPAPQ